jgi:hypothetical protein
LEFDAARAGETIQCPHCGIETVLFVPQVPIAVPSPEAKTLKASPQDDGFYVLVGQQQRGPLTLHQLRAMWADGAGS